MEPYQPDLILTNCPGCNAFLDKEQWAIKELTGKEYGIPTLSYTELAGLLLGWNPYDVVGHPGTYGARGATVGQDRDPL